MNKNIPTALIQISIGTTTLLLDISSNQIIKFFVHLYPQIKSNKNNKYCARGQIRLRGNTTKTDIDLKKQTFIISTPKKRPALPVICDMLRGAVSQFLPLSNIFLMHASVIISNNYAYIFAGSIGAGKSTIRKLLSSYTSYGDDSAVLELIHNTWRVYPSPFYETTKCVYSGKGMPIKGIYFIQKDTKTRVQKLPASTAYIEIAKNLKHYLIEPFSIKNNVPKFKTPIGMKVNALCEHAAKHIPCYTLNFSNKNLAFWKKIL